MDSTIYASRLGRTPEQIVQALNTPPKQEAPTPTPASQWSNYIYGGPSRGAGNSLYGSSGTNQSAGGVVNGPNVQEDIPNEPSAYEQAQIQQNTPAPQPSTLPLQAASVGTGALGMGQDIAPADWKYDTPPEMPKDPTNGIKEYTPEHVENAVQAVNYAMDNNAPKPQNALQAATQDSDRTKVQQDIQSVAAAKNPKQAWQTLQKQPFYKDSNFYTGMMNVGLAIMSGANPMQAFEAGKNAMDKASLSTQLGDNRQALIDQGYSPASVEAAITSGDVSKLQMQKMSDQDRMDAENNTWQARQNYLEDRNAASTAAANTEWDRRNSINQQNQLQLQSSADARYERRQADLEAKQIRMIDRRADIKRQEAAAKANSLNFDPREVNSEGRAGGYASNKQWVEKESLFHAANKDLELAREAIDSGDSQTARAGYMQAVLNAVRGEIGDRTIQIQDLGHFAEDPSIPISASNRAAIKSGFAPTDLGLKYLEKGVSVGLKTAKANNERLKYTRIESLIRSKVDPKRATALVNKVAGGLFYDPFNAFGDSSEESSPRGALSSSSTDTTSDLNGF